jgi:hypothetical protein
MSDLRPLAPDLWVVDRPLPLRGVGDIGCRMTVVRVSGVDLVLHSPVPLDADLQAELESVGEVSWLVGPSKVHHLFLRDYQDAYPDAALCGAPGLAQKRGDLLFQFELDGTPAGWPEELPFLVMDGAPWTNEVVFLHRPSRTLILTDLAFNVPERPPSARIFLWLTGAAGRFGPTRLMRLGLRDRLAARVTIRQILEWDFDRIVVSHGNVVESGGRELFRNAFDFLSP